MYNVQTSQTIKFIDFEMSKFECNFPLIHTYDSKIILIILLVTKISTQLEFALDIL